MLRKPDNSESYRQVFVRAGIACGPLVSVSRATGRFVMVTVDENDCSFLFGDRAVIR